MKSVRLSAKTDRHLKRIIFKKVRMEREEFSWVIMMIGVVLGSGGELKLISPASFLFSYEFFLLGV
jgi:hypothetical protein